jgi:hypothetical protein
LLPGNVPDHPTLLNVKRVSAVRCRLRSFRDD